MRLIPGVLALSIGLGVAAQAQPAPAITLPDILSVELPPGVTELAPDQPPLRDLLVAAKSDARPVTADLRDKIGAGAKRVTWTAWDGAATTGKAVATKAATVFVLPNGYTQVGVSGDENATAGNNATHIVRDRQGRVHMIWVDSGRPGGGAGPVYRRAVIGGDGGVQFETPPIYVADKTPGEWNAYPALTATDNAVFLAWQGGGTVRVRKLTIGSTGYEWGPVVDTGAKSEGRDVGPAIAADAAGVRVVTPAGVFALSTDGGQSWKTEPVPAPAGQTPKTASLAIDRDGSTVVAFSSVVRNIRSDAKQTGSGGYWQLRTVRRASDGTWRDAQDALAAFPAWGEPKPDQDALADWIRIGIDPAGGAHLVWHGTGTSHIYGNDQANYSYRPPNGAWTEPVGLMQVDEAPGVKFSFAPSLALDNERAIAAVFFDIVEPNRWAGFDAALVPLSRGRIDGAKRPLTRFVRASVDNKAPAFALSSRFPAAAPSVVHGKDGRAWLDVLETYIAMGVDDSAKLIVWHRVDVTEMVKP